MNRKVICALDTDNIDEALAATQRISPYVGAFKIGHALTLPHGLSVIDRLREFGASRIFLDLKFHDIPSSVGLAVREAAKHGVWMMTLHSAGGPAMMTAAVEEANYYSETERPILLGVNVLTSIDEHTLNENLGVNRTVKEQMVALSRQAIDCGLDGVVCSPNEVTQVRQEIKHEGIIVTPGIRMPGDMTHDQKRTGTAVQTLGDGADYLVMGRTLLTSDDPAATLASYELLDLADA